MKKAYDKTKKKKGNADVILITVVGFIAVIFMFAVHLAWQEMVDPFNDLIADGPLPGSVNNATSLINSFDITISVVLILLIVVTIILAFSINTHPVLFFVSLLLLMGVGILAIKFSNIFNDLSTSPTFINESGTYAASSHILNNYPKYMVIVFFIVIIITYAKISRGGGQQL